MKDPQLHFVLVTAWPVVHQSHNPEVVILSAAKDLRLPLVDLAATPAYAQNSTSITAVILNGAQRSERSAVAFRSGDHLASDPSIAQPRSCHPERREGSAVALRRSFRNDGEPTELHLHRGCHLERSAAK